MALTNNQQEYIQKYINKHEIEEISKAINVSIKEIKSYLQSIWSSTKYEKYFSNDSPSFEKPSLKKFSLRKFIKKNQFQLLLLCLFVVIAYINTIDNAFLSDDIKGILQNQRISEVGNIINNPFSLFKTTLYYLVVNIFGRTPEPFHFLNIFFHLLNSLSLFLLLKLFFPKNKTPLITSSLFAVHPILTEAVTWISGGYYVYSAFFIITSLTTYILYHKTGKNKYYWLSLILFFIGLQTTEKVIAYPGVLLFYELALGSLKDNWIKLIPYFGLSGIWITKLVGMIPQRIQGLETNHYQQVQTQNPLYQIPLAITSYLSLIFWPKGLTLYHSEMHMTYREFTIRLAILLSIISGTIYSYSRNKKLFFWLAFFPIMLSPLLTPFGVSWLVAERYVYLGSIGIFVVFAMAFNYLNSIVKIKNIALIIFFGIIIPALSLRTIVRNNDWQNQDKLWLASAKYSPSSPQNNNNLGDLYGRRKDWDKAIKHFKRAIELRPGYADAYHNLANIYWQTNQIELAIENYQNALKFNNSLWQSHQNLAIIYLNQGQHELTKKHLSKLIEIYPQHTKAKDLLDRLNNKK